MDPSFTLMLERSLASGLADKGVSAEFVNELAEAVMRVNYGQSTEAHQFVGILFYYFVLNRVSRV